MKSKRAQIGSFISNYFSLIFLAIILGVFIFTSPFIKMAVGEKDSLKEEFLLDDYQALFYQFREDFTSSIYESDIFNPSEVLVYSDPLLLKDQRILFASGNGEIILFYNSNECPIDELVTKEYDKEDITLYMITSNNCNSFKDIISVKSVNNFIDSLKKIDNYESRLKYFEENFYSLSEVSYEK